MPHSSSDAQDAGLSEVRPLGYERYREIVVLTGAGVSVASGLRPYRGPGGLWEEESPELATARTLAENPAAVWRLIGSTRREASKAVPNAAHLTLADLEARCDGAREFTLITQNVDGLHRRAGSRNVVELHGALLRTRCTNPTCDLEPYPDAEPPTEEVPLCPRCRSPLRPDVVLFDEPLPGGEEWLAKRALRTCDLFLAVGTSGTVSPASNFVRAAEFAGARTVLVNLEPMQPRGPAFSEQVLGKAEEVLPLLLR